MSFSASKLRQIGLNGKRLLKAISIPVLLEHLGILPGRVKIVGEPVFGAGLALALHHAKFEPLIHETVIAAQKFRV
jgi:hypothetical protein